MSFFFVVKQIIYAMVNQSRFGFSNYDPKIWTKHALDLYPFVILFFIRPAKLRSNKKHIHHFYQ
jgi:hypothetical protein